MRSRSHRSRALVCACVASVALANSPARAECDARPEASTCLTSDSMWPTPGPQRFAFLPVTEVASPGKFSVALVSTYQKSPIVLRVPTPGPSGTEAPAIDDQVGTTLVTSFGIVDRTELYIAIPGTLYQTGGGSNAVSGRAAPSTSSLRDPRLGGAFALVPRRSPAGLFALTAYGDVQVPTGSTTDFAGEKGFVFSPTIAADLRFAGRVTIAAGTGARLRPVSQSFFGERQGTQVLFGLGGTVDILAPEVLSIGVEARPIFGIDARSDVEQDRFGLSTSSSRSLFGGEWLASVHTSFHGFSILAGGGGTLPFETGLIGIGRMRFVLGVAYAGGVAAAPQPPPSEVAEAKPPPPNAAPEPGPTPPPAPKPKPVPMVIVPPPTPPPGGCITTCRADVPLASSQEEAALASKVTPVLNELRACLGRVGGERIRPVIIVRFVDGGAMSDFRLDLGGYEDLSCAKDARKSVPPMSVSTGRATSLRCELRCQ